MRRNKWKQKKQKIVQPGSQPETSKKKENLAGGAKGKLLTTGSELKENI